MILGLVVITRITLYRVMSTALTSAIAKSNRIVSTTTIIGWIYSNPIMTLTHHVFIFTICTISFYPSFPNRRGCYFYYGFHLGWFGKCTQRHCASNNTGN